MESLPEPVLWIILERAISVTNGIMDPYDSWIPMYDLPICNFLRGLMTTCKQFYLCVKKNTYCVAAGAKEFPCDFPRVYLVKRVYVIPQTFRLRVFYMVKDGCNHGIDDELAQIKQAHDGRVFFNGRKRARIDIDDGTYTSFRGNCMISLEMNLFDQGRYIIHKK